MIFPLEKRWQHVQGSGSSQKQRKQKIKFQGLLSDEVCYLLHIQVYQSVKLVKYLSRALTVLH